MRVEACNSADFKGVADLLDQRRLLIDDRDVVVLAGEMARDAGTDLAGTAADDLPELSSNGRADKLLPMETAQHFTLAVQGQQLHPPEPGGPGSVHDAWFILQN